MDLSPNDIRNYEFSNQMRGYDKEEVDSLLEQSASALEALKQDNLKLSMEIDSVKTQLTGLKEFEDTIKAAAIDARRNADMTVANAQKEADLILSEANAEAEKAVGARTAKISELENKISQLATARKTYLSQLRSLISNHQEMLEDIARGDAKRELTSIDIAPETFVDKADKIEVTESSEVDRGSMETIANQKTPTVTADAEYVVEDEQVERPSSKQTDTDKIPAKAEDSDSKPVDPELAAALENYARPEQNENETDSGQATPVPQVDGDFTETTARAEDVPPEFIVSNNEASELVNTGANESESQKADKQRQSGKIDMADELDSIAAKFAEEMDKAAKS